MDRFRKFWPCLLFLAAVAVGLCVFSHELAPFAVLNAPDSPPDLARPGVWHRAMSWLCSPSHSLWHDELLKIALPSLVFHEATYILDAAFQALALAAYLRIVGLPVAECCAGGLAFAFSGYNFTLFNAGHRGYAGMMPYALLLLSLAESAIRRPSPPAFVLMAVCATCGIAAQIDVFVFVALLVAAYAVFRIVSLARREGPVAFFAARVRGFALGAAILAVSFAAFGYGTVKQVFTELIPDREAQISGSAEKAEDAGKEAQGVDSGSGEDDAQWIFATNWSLPPEDIAEFVAPDLRGRDSGNRKAPYWGRLGRSFGWTPQNRSGFSDFRQHSLYMGAVPVAFAAFALVLALAGCAPQRRGLVCFWWCAAAVAVMLALGRYGFLYRAFYALPVFDKVRAPVKFVHLAEIAIAILFAHGLHGLRALASGSGAAGDRRRLRLAAKISMFALLAVAAALAAYSAFSPHPDDPARFPAAAVKGGWSAALAHGSALFAMCAAAVGACAFAPERVRARAARISIPAIAAIAAIDLASAASRYASSIDVSAQYAGSAAVDALRKYTPGDGRAWSYIMLTHEPVPGSALMALGKALDNAGFAQRDPEVGDGPQTDRLMAWIALGGDIRKSWEFWGTVGAFATPNDARALAAAGIADVVAALDLSPSGVPVRAKDPRRPRLVLVSPRRSSPPVAVWHDWTTVENDGFAAAMEAVKRPGFDLSRSIALFAGADAGQLPPTSDAPPEPASLRVSPFATDGRVAEISGHASSPGVLLLREDRMRKFRECVSATVNGAPAPLMVGNGMFFALPVPAGDLDVRLVARMPWRCLALPAAGWAVALIALAAWLKSFGKGGAANA